LVSAFSGRDLKQGRADGSKRTLDVADDQRRFDPNDVISSALERRITAGVGALASTVVRAIDLDHETLRGSKEIRNETPEQRHLPANDRAQALAADALPQELLGCSL
jgi:hypothetical protein